MIKIGNHIVNTNKYGYIRKEIYDIDYIHNLIPTYSEIKNNIKDKYIILDNDKIKVSSVRYRLFKNKGIKCYNCGIKGKFYAKEKSPYDLVYHLNLYAYSRETEILMTRDHIIRIRDGGTNSLNNQVTMCYICNQRKN